MPRHRNRFQFNELFTETWFKAFVKTTFTIVTIIYCTVKLWYHDVSSVNKDFKWTKILTYFRDGVLGQEVPGNAGECTLIFKFYRRACPQIPLQGAWPAAVHRASLSLWSQADSTYLFPERLWPVCNQQKVRNLTQTTGQMAQHWLLPTDCARKDMGLWLRPRLAQEHCGSHTSIKRKKYNNC